MGQFSGKGSAVRWLVVANRSSGARSAATHLQGPEILGMQLDHLLPLGETESNRTARLLSLDFFGLNPGVDSTVVIERRVIGFDGVELGGAVGWV